MSDLLFAADMEHVKRMSCNLCAGSDGAPIVHVHEIHEDFDAPIERYICEACWAAMLAAVGGWNYQLKPWGKE